MAEGGSGARTGHGPVGVATDVRLPSVGPSLVGATTDVTADLGADRYRALVEASAADVWVTTLDGSTTNDLPRWRAATRQTVAEILGRGWADAVHPEDRARVGRAWRDAVGIGAAFEVEYRIRPVRGPVGPEDLRIMHVRAVPVRGPDGAPVEYVGLTLDVTEQRRRDADLARLAARAAAAAERTVRLQRATAALNRSLSVSDIAQTVLAEARDGVGASGGGISLLDETGTRLRYQVLEGYDPDVKAQWSDVSVRAMSPGPDVIRTGRPLLVAGPEELRARFPTPEIERFIEVTQERAWARLPLATTGRPFGVLALGFATERGWDEEERAFVTALADLSAQALERALSYERERDRAVLLQSSLLPQRLPEVAGAVVRGAYSPGTAGVEVGGDWYDAFPVRDGRLAVVVGDVRGKGAPAASVMGQVRGAVRAHAAVDPDPAIVLSRLDLLAETFSDIEEIVTLTYCLLDPVTGTLTHTSAGHLPGLLHSPQTGLLPLTGAEGLPLGVTPRTRLSATTVLPPGGTLLLFTDGLVERRDRALTDGLSALETAMARAPRSAHALDVDRLVEHLRTELLPPAPEDDVTILAVQRVDRPEPDADRAAEVDLPSEVMSAGAARSFLRHTLSAWGLADLVDVAALLANELVTNAIVHAQTRSRLELVHRPGRLRIAVHDAAGAAQPRPRDADEHATNGRGLALVESLAARWGVEQDGRGGKTVWLELDA